MATVFGTVGNDLLTGTPEADWFNGLQGDDQLNLSTDGNFGTDGNDTAYGGYGFDNIFGGNGDDFLVGGAPGADGLDDGSSRDGSDFIDGGGGNDNILGGFGQDTLAGDVGNDTLYGQGDNDTVNGGTGNDFLFGGDSTSLGGVSNASGNDSISGADGDDNIYGEDGNDTLNGGNGADVFYGGTGDDELSGGEDSDFMIGGGWTPDGGIAGAGELSSGRDTINGEGGNDYIWAGDDNDVLSGGSGNDTLYGGAGADFMSGGNGDDVFYVDNAADTVDDRPGAEGGTDAVIVQVTYEDDVPDPITGLPDTYNLLLLGPEAEIESIILESAEPPLVGPNFNAVGNQFSNAIQGNSGSNFLVGLGGRDTLNGLSGNDTLLGGEGGDDLVGGEGSDLIGGRRLPQGVFFTEDQEGIATGNDTILGEAGNDTLIGNDGDDNMVGGDGNDNLGAVVTAVPVGGVGVLVAALEAGSDTLDGGEGDDSLSGGIDSDSLIGGAGNDFLSDGSYTLNPLTGRYEWTGQQTDLDTLEGGAGNDTYFIDRFNRSTGVRDTIIELADEGTDTVFYSGTTANEATYVLGANLENLTLGRSFIPPALVVEAPLNGSGNELNNNIRGNNAANRIFGKEGADTLTGDQVAAGVDLVTDIFGYLQTTDSLFNAFDTITEFDLGVGAVGTQDQFGVNIAFAGLSIGAGGVAGAIVGNASTLDTGAIGSVLTNTIFLANQAALFTVGTSRLFVGINNATAGYQSNADAIIEITGALNAGGVAALTGNNFVILGSEFV